jgi:hypothetical protein
MKTNLPFSSLYLLWAIAKLCYYYRQKCQLKKEAYFWLRVKIYPTALKVKWSVFLDLQK